VQLRYSPAGGRFAFSLAKLLREDPGQMAQEALRCIKQVMEVGEVTISDGALWDNGFLTQRPAQPVSNEEVSEKHNEEQNPVNAAHHAAAAEA
jgi:hypothetical protein